MASEGPSETDRPTTLSLSLGRLCIIVSSNIHPIRKREFRLRHHPIFNPSAASLPYRRRAAASDLLPLRWRRRRRRRRRSRLHTIWKVPPANLVALPFHVPSVLPSFHRSNERSRPCFCRTHRTRREGRNFSHCTLLKKVFMSYNARATADCTALPPFDGWLIPCLPT